MWSVLALQVTEPTSEVPDHIRPNHLIKELTKEIRYLEVREGKNIGGGLKCYKKLQHGTLTSNFLEIVIFI